jgi:hypothetical protein
MALAPPEPPGQGPDHRSHPSDLPLKRHATGRRQRIARKPEMNPFDKNGVLTRDEAVRALLDEAVSRAIQAEAQQHGDATTGDLNRQCAEILKFIAEKL